MAFNQSTCLNLIFLTIFLFSCQPTLQACPEKCYCYSDGLVNCANRGLTSVPSNLPLNTAYLNFTNNNITSFPDGSINYLINLTYLDIRNNRVDDKGFTSASVQGLKLLLLHADNNKLFNFPTFLSRSIQDLSVAGNSVYNVDLSFYPNLMKLDLSSTYTMSIPYNMFSTNTELRSLYLCGNMLQTLEPGAFRNQNKLTVLNLINNRLTSAVLNAATFQGLLSLQNLSLAQNPLTSIPVNLPPTLTALDLSFTDVAVLGQDAFYGLPSLELLDLSGLDNLQISPNAFSGLPNVEWLFMNNGNIVPGVINGAVLSGFTKLKYFEIQNSSIGAIEPGSFDHIPGTLAIYASNNEIATLEPAAFSNRTAYWFWDLSDNPFWCDCNLRWLKEHVMKDMENPQIPDPSRMTCTGPTKVAGKTFEDLKPEDFVCGFK